MNKPMELTDDKYFPNASKQGTLDYVKDRLEDGVNPNSLSDSIHPTTAIHYACEKDDVDKLKLLLQHGGNTEVLSGDNETPLQWACYFTSPKCVKLLLEEGANPNADKGVDGDCMDLLGSYDNRYLDDKYRPIIDEIKQLLKKHGYKANK
jgi:ankyrin repeat protein